MWHGIPKANSMFCAYSTYAPAALHGAGECAYTHSMFQALRFWELGKLRRVLCFRRRPNECWADHMKRTGVIAARQLRKHNQTRLQSLAMRRVRIAAWQMVSCPSDAKGRRYWEESVTWRTKCGRTNTSNCPTRTTGTARSGNVLFLADRTTGNVPSRASWVRPGYRS